jgi:hypothetical protein
MGLRGACRGYEAMMTEKGADCWDIIMSANLPIHEHGLQDGVSKEKS